MLAVLLAAAFPTTTTLGWLLAQQTSADWNPYAQLAQIGIGALIAAPFIYVWRQAEKRAEAANVRANAAELRCEQLQQAAIHREREIGDGTTVLLERAAETLRDTQRGMDAVVDRVKSPDPALDLALRRLELMADEMQSERRRRRGSDAESGG